MKSSFIGCLKKASTKDSSRGGSAVGSSQGSPFRVLYLCRPYLLLWGLKAWVNILSRHWNVLDRLLIHWIQRIRIQLKLWNVSNILSLSLYSTLVVGVIHAGFSLGSVVLLIPIFGVGGYVCGVLIFGTVIGVTVGKFLLALFVEVFEES